MSDIPNLRVDGRSADQLRPVSMQLGYVDYPEGSVLIAMGNTRVLCNATVLDKVPNWKRAQQVPGGWVTAEYSMLPRATHTRMSRETSRPRGRTQEIQRLIGRSLRQAVDLEELGMRTFTIDCDVIQADSGTRTAAITGGYVALALAIQGLIVSGNIVPEALRIPVAAVSVGIYQGQAILDLCYEEDRDADVDVNVVMTGAGEFVEVQGTGEGTTFARDELDALLDLAYVGVQQLLQEQARALKS